MDSPHVIHCFGFCCFALHPRTALDFTFHIHGFCVVTSLDFYQLGSCLAVVIATCSLFVVIHHHHLEFSSLYINVLEIARHAEITQIDLFSSLPGIILRAMRFLSSVFTGKAPANECFCCVIEQPVQFTVRGDLKNMECNPMPYYSHV